jgi:hypothetical protein
MSEGGTIGWKQLTTWMITIVFSGLCGGLFTNWYANRSTVIEYSVNKTVLAQSNSRSP